ncbi:ROK family protein [Microbacterium trichothecenolyticum]|uniref:ROK family protein n=1 Tax=Microbacterium trichothecenolyticum TaxID=69370 RepID=UPI0035BE2111
MTRQNRMIVALDIGGTKIASALVDDTGARRSPVSRRPTPRDGEGIVRAVIDQAAAAKERAERPVDGIGIATAGVVDRQGRVVAATDLLPGWAGRDLAGDVERALGTPTTALNDVHATAVAEHALGSARGLETALIVAVGTGIGGAIVSRGRLAHGRTGLAGTFAHLPSGLDEGRRCACGEVDHLEPYVSGPGMQRTYRNLSGVDTRLEQIAHASRHGDALAGEALASGGRLLGRWLAHLATTLDPDAVIVGGGAAGTGDPYWSSLRQCFAESAYGPVREVPVRAAALGTDAPLVGAALAAVGALTGSIPG